MLELTDSAIFTARTQSGTPVLDVLRLSALPLRLRLVDDNRCLLLLLLLRLLLLRRVVAGLLVAGLLVAGLLRGILCRHGVTMTSFLCEEESTVLPLRTRNFKIIKVSTITMLNIILLLLLLVCVIISVISY